MIKATIKLVLNNVPMSNGLYAVYLRIIKDRRRKLISLGLYCEKKNFIGESFTKHHENHQIENEILLKLKSRALEIIRTYKVNQEDFTLREFEEKFRGKKKASPIDVLDFFDEIVDEMKRSGRMGNAKAYNDTKNSLKKFVGTSLHFKEITPSFLDKYTVFLRETGSKNGGVAFRMRQLRALVNKARNRKLIPKEPYAFDDYKISKLKLESRRIALSMEEYKKIRDVDLSNHPHLVNYYYYFMFSIFTRGMNFYDMMLLKWHNIDNGRIYYTRAKTKGKLNLEILPPVQEILDYYKKQNRPTGYVFPILLEEDLTPTQIFNRRHKIIGRYNRRIKDIAILAGLEKRPTTYVARHSFATILKFSGVPIEKISEMMGHGDVSITIAYLKEFSNEDLDEENRKILDL